MARRNLLQEAQVTAAAEVAPQIAALSEALSQARSDRNAAIHTAAAGSKGIGRAINRAQGTIKRAYKDSAGLGSAPQSYASAAFGGAAANERAVTGTVLASSLANALKEGSDRRIEAAAGRAYRSAAAENAYRGQVAGIQTKRQNVAAQQGLLTGAALSKLTEAQAGRDFQASQQARSQAFQASEGRLSRKNARIVGRQGQEFQAGQQEDQQAFAAGQDAKDRKFRAGQAAKDRAATAAAKGPGGVKPTADHVYKGRQSIQLIADAYKSNSDMSDVVKDAIKQGYPRPLIEAAADLHTKGGISPLGVQKLARLGYTVPKEWTLVKVKPHTRKRKGR